MEFVTPAVLERQEPCEKTPGNEHNYFFFLSTKMIKFRVGKSLETGPFVLSEPWMVLCSPVWILSVCLLEADKSSSFVGPSLLPESGRSNVSLHLCTGQVRDWAAPNPALGSPRQEGPPRPVKTKANQTSSVAQLLLHTNQDKVLGQTGLESGRWARRKIKTQLQSRVVSAAEMNLLPWSPHLSAL